MRGKKMKKILFIGLFLLAGCSVFYPTWNNSSLDIMNSAEIKEDSFAKTKIINFTKVKPYILQDRKKITGTYDTLPGYFLIRTFMNIEKNTPEIFQILIVTDVSSSWGFYNKAIDKDGTELKFTKIDRQIKTNSAGVDTVEYFALSFDLDYLKKHKNDNLIIKVFGQRDEFVFYVPQSYLDGVFKYFEKTNK